MLLLNNSNILILSSTNLNNNLKIKQLYKSRALSNSSDKKSKNEDIKKFTFFTVHKKYQNL